jgi:hypothetical protein
MEIVLIVAIAAVAAAALYVAVTFNRRTRKTTAPQIADAVQAISDHVAATAAQLSQQIQYIADDLRRDREELRLDERKIQGRLDHADSRFSSLAGQFLAELDALKSRAEQAGERQDQLSADLYRLAVRLGVPPEPPTTPIAVAPASAPAIAPAVGTAVGTAVPGRLYAERLEFSLARNETASPAEPMVRIEVTRYIGELPAEQFRDAGDAAAITGRAERDQGFRDRLDEAASEYFATTWGDPAFAAATERWMTQDAYPEIAAAALCSRIGSGLNAIVARPIETMGTEIRLPGPAAAAGAGIGADLILQPVTRSLAGAARFCEIVGIVVGVATGFHPLALAAGKMLARDEFHRVLARGISEAARTLIAGPARPPAGRAGAAEIRGTLPDRRLDPPRDRLSGPRRPDEPRGPSVRGPRLS